jgi:glutathione S-transferase
MAINETSNPKIKSLQGVHLYHFGMSSCSQRVRFALEEKGIEWQSHPVNLHLMENATSEYQQIHPKGYVPAFIHDGTLLLESVDIIAYVDDVFDGPELHPNNEKQKCEMQKWIDLSNANQWCLKHLTYELIFKKLGHYSDPKEVDYYLAHQKNPELLQFVKDFVAGFSDELVQSKINEAYEFLSALNERLCAADYLAGNGFSLADIAAIVNVHRYKLCGLHVEQYANLVQWYTKVAARDGFQRAVVAWEPR